ncbi:MAG: ureidoglycolate lyase, partial [Rhodobacterales bacterium]
MIRTITTRPLIQNEFAIFGDVLEVTGKPDNIINQGMC